MPNDKKDVFDEKRLNRDAVAALGVMFAGPLIELFTQLGLKPTDMEILQKPVAMASIALVIFGIVCLLGVSGKFINGGYGYPQYDRSGRYIINRKQD